MSLAVTVGLLIFGIVLIVKGGDFFVDAASWMAEVSGIPKLIIGATVVSLATTLPEMLVSMMAALDGKVDMSIGNAVGSVTANIGLIMAISVFCIPAVIKRSDYLLKSILMLVAAGLIVLSGLFGSVSVPVSVVLLIVFVIFMWENVSSAKKAMKLGAEEKAEKHQITKKEIAINVLKFVVGTIGIVWGADLLVDNGSELARIIGISERIIGVTVIAVGTSLPELITTITAIVKKESALSVGNIIGANVLDLTLIMPLCAVVSGKQLPISANSARLDLPACLIVGMIALVPAMVSERFRRWQGVVLLAVYSVYIFLTCTAV